MMYVDNFVTEVHLTEDVEQRWGTIAKYKIIDDYNPSMWAIRIYYTSGLSYGSEMEFLPKGWVLV